ncbi:MAG: hypothetical protein KAQ62_11265, partial [Cyclobacteriaceae bacterium]|nr:hypothetical protein [Cyclobacteriaceae bacterium]
FSDLIRFPKKASIFKIESRSPSIEAIATCYNSSPIMSWVLYSNLGVHDNSRYRHQLDISGYEFWL